jgi:hypothetical protein
VGLAVVRRWPWRDQPHQRAGGHCRADARIRTSVRGGSPVPCPRRSAASGMLAMASSKHCRPGCSS